MAYLLIIDQGTTGTAISLIDHSGNRIKTVDQQITLYHPQPGWVEQDPEEIWKSVLTGIKKILSEYSVAAHQVVAIGITNQRETTIAWSRDGRPIGRAIVWQCRRTSKRADGLKNKESYFRRKTGLVVDAYFSATKMEWMLEQNQIRNLVKRGNIFLGTVDSYLIYRLTGGSSFVTDVSNASRTLLMNVQKLNWDNDLLNIFHIRPELLPTVLPSNALFGHTKGIDPLPDGIPIYGVLGDQQAALFGQLGWQEGEAKVTLGTGSFILMNIGHKFRLPPKGLLTTVAWQFRGHQPVYAFEGGAYICGAAVQWLRDKLHLIQSSQEIEERARRVTDNGGVVFVPALSGLGAPYWKPHVRGAFLGLTGGVTADHICRAVLESIAHQNADILEVMETKSPVRLRHVRIDGGASQNQLLCQMHANYFSTPVETPEDLETTTLGAAYMAGLGCGFWSSLSEIQNFWRRKGVYFPERGRAANLARKAWKSQLKKIIKFGPP